jgi:hypothetical protein
VGEPYRYPRMAAGGTVVSIFSITPVKAHGLSMRAFVILLILLQYIRRTTSRFLPTGEKRV